MGLQFATSRKNQGFRKRHWWTQTKKGGDRKGRKGDIICQWSYKCFPRKNSPEYLSPQNNKEQSGTLPCPDVLEFHPPAPTPQLQVGLDEGSHLNHLVSQCRERLTDSKNLFNKNLLSAYCVPGYSGTSQWTKTGTKKASSLLELPFQWGKPTS